MLIFYVFLGLLILALAFRLFFFMYWVRPFLSAIPVRGEFVEEGVSVVICARNELSNLQCNLTAWLGQDHHDYEVIVVDDQSEDGTGAWLKEMEQQNPRLKVVSVGGHLREYPGKKLALLLGIKKARHDCILVSDADCYPAGTAWLKTMVSGFSGDKKIVLGHAPDQPRKGVLSAFFRFETLFTALQYLSLTNKGRPYMGVGRNMGYRKSFFLGKGGFSGMLNIPSGDDDLFVSRYATAENTALVVAPEAFVYSPSKSQGRTWLRQKQRHLTAGLYYPVGIRFLLAMIWLSGVLFYLPAGLLLWQGFYMTTVGGIVAGGVLMQGGIYWMAYQKLGSLKDWPGYLLWDILYHCIYYPVAGSITWLSSGQKMKW